MERRRKPTPSPLKVPEGYGDFGTGGAEKLPWSGVRKRLASARNYWIGTTRTDGRPHATPVWVVWLDGALPFGTGRRSQKGRNLAGNPEVVAHFESGDQVVILEGVAEEVTDPSLLAEFGEATPSSTGSTRQAMRGATPRSTPCGPAWRTHGWRVIFWRR